MKRTLKTVATVALAGFVVASCSSLNKMKRLEKNIAYKVTPEMLEAKGGQVDLKIDATIPAKYFNKKVTLVATPVLKFQNGGEKAYEPKTFQGEKVQGNNEVVPYATEKTVNYSGTVPFEEGMRVSGLYVKFQGSKGKKSADYESRKIADGVIATATMVNNAPAIAIGADQFERITKEEQEAAIYYLINSANIRSKQMTSEELKNLILHGNKEIIKEVLENIHPADILDILHEDEDSSKEILEHLPNEVIGDILDEEDDEELILEWLNLFSKYKQKQILDEVSHDVITDVIGSIEDEDEKNAFLELLEDDDKEDVKQLLQYNPETAGGIMTTEYLDIHANNTVKETLLFLQTTEEEPRHYLYVVDKENVLKGVVSLGDIVTSTFDTPMLEITNQNVKAVYYYEDQEEVAKTFSKYGYILMPVIDEQHHLLGVIDIDDVMDVIEEETTEDMNLLGGVGSEERLDSTLVESFKNRIPWLIVNLFTAIMASSVVSVFEGTIAKVVALATISPIITGMGGNAGTQTLTIVVRGLSLGELDKENARKVLLKEIGLGILNGVVIGALVSVGAWFFAGNPWFGVVAGVAMICNMIVATLAGYFVPVILDRFHVDPALASGVFVTTCTDMFGFFAFLGLATILMSHLL